MTTIPTSRDDSGPAARPVLLLTRPRAAAERFAQEVQPWDGAVILSPLLDIVAVPYEVPEPAPKAVIFTSAQAVRFFEASRFALGGLPAYCVGRATTQAAADKGFDARTVGPDAASLIAALPDLRPPAPILHLRGVHIAQPVASKLTRAGLQCGECCVYDQVAQRLTPAARDALAASSAVILPVFSPRSADLLGAALKESAAAAPCQFVAISPVVAARITAYMPDARVATAVRPDAAAMVNAVHASARHAHPLEGGTPLP